MLGGWITVLYAALDPRITSSIQAAGSYPQFLRSQANYDWGDFYGVAVKGDFAYVTDVSPLNLKALKVFDISDPANLLQAVEGKQKGTWIKKEF